MFKVDPKSRCCDGVLRNFTRDDSPSPGETISTGPPGVVCVAASPEMALERGSCPVAMVDSGRAKCFD